MKKTLAILLVLVVGLFAIACDSPSENATEERLEDKGEAQGMREDPAEKQAEDITDTGGTALPTDTSMTTGTTATTVTTATSATTT
ncbi:MAG TPA: hypothetical protein VEK57_16565 [Thermoanaerobaculia bacterium]|nr:hypothetical protein [Thermoanaerobaculia bacterium]